MVDDKFIGQIIEPPELPVSRRHSSIIEVLPYIRQKVKIKSIICVASLFASTECTVGQDMFRTLSQFPIAFPLKLDVADKFKVMLPLFTGPVIKWETTPGTIIENHLFNDPFKLIVAVRIGTNSQEKSTILNQLMTSNSMFFSCSEPRAEYGVPHMIGGSVEFTWLAQETCRVSLWNDVFEDYYKKGANKEIVLLENLHALDASMFDIVNTLRLGESLEMNEELPLGERRRALAHLEREVSRISIIESAEARNQAVFKKNELRKSSLGKRMKKKIREEIAKIWEEVDNMSLGLEHFFRELGQIYKIFSVNYPDSEIVTKLPELYSELLISGQTIELLDGDAGAVSEAWFGAPEKMDDPESEKKDRILATLQWIAIVTMVHLQKAGMAPDILMVQHISERNVSRLSEPEEKFRAALKDALKIAEERWEYPI
ncbi:hypothetical protein C1645_814707 [Glomus cerebriforme]|uniref:Uncharacterized protein n=1 Tax=Glomus cerebriforme TaxID=658196 RepID=A0A397TFG3_9GLOM|nr:hypothetical protein C1645_814707 [Glomus cerebriforme]